MREITKTLTIPVDGIPKDFRLTKLDAFSGASLLRMLAKIPGSPGAVLNEQSLPCYPERSACHPERSEGSHPQSVPFLAFFSAFSDSDLRALMTVCLEHTEVSLPAGWNPVMTRGEWAWPELKHDTAVCLKLTAEEVLWTLEGFFGERVPDSRPGTPAS